MDLRVHAKLRAQFKVADCLKLVGVLAWIVCNKPNGHYAISRNSDGVFGDRTDQVSLEQEAPVGHVLDGVQGRWSFEPSESHHVEAVAVEVEDVFLLITTYK